MKLSEYCTYSFIICRINSPKLLNRCVNSIPRRDDVEIIVVDDNSDTRIVDWSQFHFDDPRCITLIQDKSGKGAGNAHNVGITYAHGKWLLFPDADDFYLPEFLDVLNSYKDANLNILYFNFILISVYGTQLSHPIISYVNTYCKDGIGLGYIQYKNNPPWDKMVRTEFIKAYDCKHECVPSGNDMSFSFQIAYFAKKIQVTNESLYSYIRYAKSQTNRNWIRDNIYVFGKSYQEKSILSFCRT